MGKDIITTHAVYWPTFLMSAGLPLPRTILAHGWWLIADTKMGKSLGNVVKPIEMAEKYGHDAFRYFLMRDMVLGQDSNFSEEALDRADQLRSRQRPRQLPEPRRADGADELRIHHAGPRGGRARRRGG